MTVRQRTWVRRCTGADGPAIIGGDWDRKQDGISYSRFTEKLKFKSCYMHWVEGVRWEETPYFRKYVRQMAEKGKVVAGHTTVSGLQERYRTLDAVFERIRRDGAMSTRPEHLITIHVARDGRLIFGPNGKHRLAIALILDLPHIPARLGFVHPGGLGRLRELRAESARPA